MRARLMMKLIGFGVMIALTVLGFRTFGSSSPNSPASPSNLLNNGLSGVCADQQATASAAGDTSPETVVIPPVGNQLSGLAAGAGIKSGTFTCPTTTVAGNG